ncbi:hypothetical protein [Suicoccus acidiformans]|nr:hypothetical protein [Suicoccus acidiformans]
MRKLRKVLLSSNAALLFAANAGVVVFAEESTAEEAASEVV